MKIQFTEKQKFTQWWFWLIFIGLGAIAVYASVTQLFLDIQFGNNPMSDLGVILFTLCSFGGLYFNWYMALFTEINDLGIEMRFVPFVKKNITWNQLASMEIVHYGSVGYGIRLGSPHGTVYNINGNMGLALTMKNGTKFVIGTQQPAALKRVLEKIKSTHGNSIQ